MIDRQKAELTALSDDEIGTSIIPEVADWPNAKRGVIYRLAKQRITPDLNADVIAWFKSGRAAPV